MRRACCLVFLTAFVYARIAYPQKSGAQTSVDSLLTVKRIYVAQLTGGVAADALRDLIISSIDSTKLFILTDNEERADAILKGAADDRTFTDTFDSASGVSTRENGGKTSSGSTGISRAGGIYGGLSVGDNEAHHIKERKHEAYATVRLCNKEGDVLWSTTQESSGAKFRGASNDVAAKIARQLSLDVEQARRAEAAPTTAKP
ncbi:MAG: hypothetical protein JO033_16630 [Acidobacteriaceae bacterium]|nr:hypothetical protein [Acidobacteriaceae bacterium]MBV9497989.1 hypothetical protein [Acidobacteriaceae bacterium]